MKTPTRLILAISSVLILVGCNDATNQPPVVQPTLPLPAAAVFAQQKNCLACHSQTGNMVGPAWNNIAEHYKNDPTAASKLTEKVLNGGTGSFGSANMPPQENNLTSDEASYLVKWVLNGAPN